MNRIMNSIKMGALCDALGVPLEFKTNNFDNVTYDDYEITDDTQMTLFVMEGLTQGNVKKALLEWYCTQSYGNDIKNPMCWFFKDKRMHKQMAPGLTCLSSLEELYYNNEREKNDSKGNGALIRSAPYGMLNCDSIEAYEKAYKDSLITHDHYYSAVSSGIFAYMINLILKENITIEEATKRGIEYLKEIENTEEIIKLLESALYLCNNPDRNPYDSLGEGWVAEECLAIAVYSALFYEKTKDLNKAIKLAIHHKGDSDSTGAVFGNLVGLFVNNVTEKTNCDDIIIRVVNYFCEKFKIDNF